MNRNIEKKDGLPAFTPQRTLSFMYAVDYWKDDFKNCEVM